MAKRFFQSFFRRIYLFAFAALLCGVWLTNLMLQSHFESDDLNYFTRIASNVAKMREDPAHAPVNLEEFSRIFAPNNPARFVQADQMPAVCANCQLIDVVGDIRYYRASNELFIAVLPEDSEGQNLVLSFNGWEDEDNGLVIATLIVTVTILFSIAIHWPLQYLRNTINSLIRVYREFGNGNLSARANESIDAPLDNLARNFNLMATDIEEGVREREVFAQAIPHEVRTPLSRIRLANGLLRKPQPAESQQKLLNDIDGYIDDIDELIAQIVELSRLNTNREEQENSSELIHLESFIQQRVNALTPPPHIQVRVTAPSIISVNAQPSYLRLILDNLLSNALKHAESMVCIAVSAVSSGIEITVEDDGPGIPPTQRDTVFVPFSRLDASRSRKTGGLGLGLTIARAAARRIQGSIQIDTSHQFGGAAVTIDLPQTAA